MSTLGNHELAQPKSSPGGERRSSVLLALALSALMGATGCNAPFSSSASDAIELNEEIIAGQLAVMYLTQNNVLSIVEEELEGIHLMVVIEEDSTVDDGFLFSTEYEFAGHDLAPYTENIYYALDDVLDESWDRIVAEVGASDQHWDLYYMIEDALQDWALYDDQGLARTLEQSLIPMLRQEMPLAGAGDDDDEEPSCKKLRLDWVRAVEVKIDHVSLRREDDSLRLDLRLSNIGLAVKKARYWFKTLWCNVVKLEDFYVSFPGESIDISVDLTPHEKTTGFYWPGVPFECNGTIHSLNAQSLYYGDELPAESATIARDLDYSSLEMTYTVDYGGLGTPELDFENSVTQAIVDALATTRQVVTDAANATSCFFGELLGDGSICDLEQAETDPGTFEFEKDLDFFHFAVQDLHAVTGYSTSYLTFDHVLDEDWDYILPGLDNCPDTSNFSQTDSDYDGVGDACDPEPESISQAEMDAALEAFLEWFYMPLCFDLSPPNWELLGIEDALAQIHFDPLVDSPVLDTPLLENLRDDFLDDWLSSQANGPIIEGPYTEFVPPQVAIQMAKQHLQQLAVLLGRPGLNLLQPVINTTPTGQQRLGWIDPAGVTENLTGAEIGILVFAVPSVRVGY